MSTKKTAGKNGTTSIIEISDIGPVIHRTIPIPPRGCVVVLKGYNGSGKSRVLDATRSLLGAKLPIEKRDDAERGTISGFGSSVTIAKQQRRGGKKADELEVVHIEDRFDISQIVDPGKADPKVNDAIRLKALVQIAGKTIPFERFQALVPSRNGESPDISPAAHEGDLVNVAATVKAIFHAEARVWEKRAKEETDQQRACEAAAGSVDEAEAARLGDLQGVQREFADAMTAHGELSKAAEAAALDAQRRSEASEAIKRATVQYAGPTLKVAREAAKTAEAAVEAARANVVSIRQQLEAAMAELATAQAAQDLAGATLDAAESFEDNIAQWRKILHTPALCAPTADEIAAAAARLQEARQDMTNAVRLQEAIQNRHKAAERAAIAKNHAEYGAQLRTAADAAEALLAEAIDFADLRWFADRLLYRHEDGREELFDRLSDGQRWKVAISVGAARVRPESGDGTNLLILPQAAWQDLDPDNKDLVNDLAVTEGVAILTAECSRGPLRAVVYGEPDPHSVHESMPSDKHDSSHG